MFEYIPSKPLNILKCRILRDDILFYPVSTNCEKYILIKMSTIPPISKKQTTFHLKQLNTKKTMTYGIGNPGPSFEQAQTCVRVKPVNGIPNFPVYKQTIKTCIDSLPLKKTTITITKDNINMDCTIAGSDTKICSPTERFASQVHHDAFRKLKLLSMSKSAYLPHSREIDGLFRYANFCLTENGILKII
jgi:hypothetical protein